MTKESMNSYLYRMIRCINQDDTNGFYQVLEQLIKSREDKPGDITKQLQNLHNARPRKMQLISSNKELNNLVTMLKPQKKELILSVSEQYNDIIKEHKNKELFAQHNLTVSNKILLVGLPGNGKTSIAHNLACDLNLPFIQVNNAAIVGSLLGKTSVNVGHVMKISEPCVLFFDEIDSIALSRDSGKHDHSDVSRALNVMLIEMERMHPDVVFVAATNRYDNLDKALVRRFDEVLEVQPPDENQKKEFLQLLYKQYGMGLGDIYETLLCSLTNYSNIEKEYKKIMKKNLLSEIE